MEDKLQLAVSLIKAGDKVSAGEILADLVKREPGNEWAWYWLAVCVKPINQKKTCLQRALQLNPSNQQAQQALDRLGFIDREAGGWFERLTSNRGWLWAGLGIVLLVVALIVVAISTLSAQAAAAQEATAPTLESTALQTNPARPVKLVPTSLPAPTRATKYTPVPGYDPNQTGGTYNLPPAPDGFTWQVIPDLLMNTLVPEDWYFTQTVEDEIDVFFVTKEALSAEGEFSTGMSVRIYRNIEEADQAAQDLIFDVTNQTTTTRVVDTLKLDSKTKTVTMYSVLISETFSDRKADDPNYRKKRVFDVIADTFKKTLYVIEFESPLDSWEAEWNERGGPITLSVINLLFAWR